MSLLRRRRKDAATPQSTWAPGWDVPTTFNFTRDVIAAHARRHTLRAYTAVDREGIIDRRTFGEVAEAAARWAHALRSRAPRGASVVVLAGTTVDPHLAVLGALQGGLVVVPSPADLPADELALRVRRTRARAVVAPRAAEAAVSALLDGVDDPPEALFFDDAVEELRRYRPVAPVEETGASEPALVLFTAGDTAEPRAVVHTNAALWATRVVGERWLGVEPGDLVWATARPGWPAWAWHGLFAPWSAGGELVIHDADAFDADARVDLVQRLGVSVLCQTPTEHRALVERGAIVPRAFPRLRQVVSTGGPLAAELVEAFRDAGLNLRDGLSQAECALVAGTLVGERAEEGVLGGPLPGLELRVQGSDGHLAAVGEPGEVCVLGGAPPLPAGHLDDSGVLVPAGDGEVHRTGDVCTADAAGRLTFVGRADDVIVSGGLRIGPTEVERAILSCPGVSGAAVVATPDRALGSAIAAFVTVSADAPDDVAAAIVRHLDSAAAPHLVPARIEVVDALPHTTTGLLDRSELRRREEERAAQAAAAVAEQQRLDATRAAEDHRRQVDEDEARHRREQEEASARAAAERQRLLDELEAERERAAAAEREREKEARAAAALREREAAEEERRRAEERARLAAEAEAAAREEERRAREAEQERAAAQAREQERAAAEAEALAVAAREERERQAAEQARLEAEERSRSREADRAARLAAAEAAASERAQEAAAAERARVEQEAAAARERAEREAALRRAEDERREQERAEREARRRDELERREREQAERAEREAAANAERDARKAEEAARRSAEEDRRQAEQLEREARRREEQERREREQAERAQREAQAKAEREAARRAEQEAKEREKTERAQREAQAKAEREAARRAEQEAKQREQTERAQRDRRGRLRTPKPAVPEPEDAGVDDSPIPGLVDRLRIYADGAVTENGAPATEGEASAAESSDSDRQSV